jgi:hypothetical protein
MSMLDIRVQVMKATKNKYAETTKQVTPVNYDNFTCSLAWSVTTLTIASSHMPTSAPRPFVKFPVALTLTFSFFDAPLILIFVGFVVAGADSARLTALVPIPM